MFRKTLLDILIPSITLVKWLKKSIRLKVLLIRSKKNGNILNLPLNSIRKRGKSKELMLFLQHFKIIWGSFLLKKLVFFMKISKMRSRHGKTTCRRSPRLYRCWCRCNVNGFTYRLFLLHNKTKIGN